MHERMNKERTRAPAHGLPAFPGQHLKPTGFPRNFKEAQDAQAIADEIVPHRRPAGWTPRRRQRLTHNQCQCPPNPRVVRAVTLATGDVWQRLRSCESGNTYTRNSGNGYYGAYQFSASTWHSLGYPGLPHQADPATQDQAAQRLLARSGWGQWPGCSRAIGAR